MALRALRVLPLLALFAVLPGCSSGDAADSAASSSATVTDERPASAEVTTAAAAPAASASRCLGGSTSPPTSPRRGATARRFVVERPGRIRVLSGRRVLKTPFLDISSLVTTGGESGLLSMAFAKDYARSGRFYVYYTDSAGYIRIDELRRSASNPNRADPASRRLVMRVPHHRFNHKGGQLQIGPDGYLYAGFGDGGGGGDPDLNGQNLSRQLAKLIRISPRPGGGYSVPRDNPFRGRAGARPETYAYGLRNPYRFSFDRRTGSLTIGDVGQDAVEEIDYVPNTRGRGHAPRGGYNFGWSVFEGNSRYRQGSAPHARPPALTHAHSDGYCSITGGYVIRDRSLGRALYGKYVYGDYCNGRLRVAALRPRAAHSRALAQSVEEPRVLRRGRPRPGVRRLARRTRVPPGPGLGEGQLDGAQGVELEPYAVPGAHARRRGEHAGDDQVAVAKPLSRRLQPLAHGRDHRLQVGAGPVGGDLLALLAVHEKPPGARRRRLHARPEGHRPVEDVAREDALARPRTGPECRPPRAPGSRATIVRPSSPSSTATSGSATVGRPSVAYESPSASRPAVERNPASGASIPSFSCTAGTLKPTFQPSGWAPDAIALAPPLEHGARGCGHVRLAHGRITILSASRRS